MQQMRLEGWHRGVGLVETRKKRTNVLDDARTTRLGPTMGHLRDLWVRACFRRGRKVRHTTLFGTGRKHTAHTWQILILALFHWCIVSLIGRLEAWVLGCAYVCSLFRWQLEEMH